MDGKVVATAKLSALINKDPNNGMEVGTDASSLVVASQPGDFHGLVEQVTIIANP